MVIGSIPMEYSFLFLIFDNCNLLFNIQDGVSLVYVCSVYFIVLKLVEHTSLVSPHQWCNGYRTRHECAGSCVRATVG